MIRSKIFAIVLVALAAAFGASVAAAQETQKPIRLKAPKPQIVKFRGEVVHSSSVQMVVRSTENEKVVRTFTYSPAVKQQMEKIIDRGGYQPGDRVEVHHESGSDVALKIKGKPSRP
jgi:hypothetical protein